MQIGTDFIVICNILLKDCSDEALKGMPVQFYAVILVVYGNGGQVGGKMYSKQFRLINLKRDGVKVFFALSSVKQSIQIIQQFYPINAV